MNDAHPQQHTKEEISRTPTVFAEDVAIKPLENVREPSWDPSVSSSSKYDENQLDPNLDQQFTSVEKSFKNEEYIYVSIFSLPIWISKNDRYFLL